MSFFSRSIGPYPHPNTICYTKPDPLFPKNCLFTGNIRHLTYLHRNFEIAPGPIKFRVGVRKHTKRIRWIARNRHPPQTSAFRMKRVWRDRDACNCARNGWPRGQFPGLPCNWERSERRGAVGAIRVKHEDVGCVAAHGSRLIQLEKSADTRWNEPQSERRQTGDPVPASCQQ